MLFQLRQRRLDGFEVRHALRRSSHRSKQRRSLEI